MHTNAYKRVARLKAVIVLAIAMLAFAVSFEAIRDYAVSVGAVSRELGWIVPLLVDTFIVVASLAIWLRSLDGERAWLPMSMLIVASVVSLVLNVAHAPHRFSAQAVAAIPPAALIASVHVVMAELRRSVQRRQKQEQAEREAAAAREQEQAADAAMRAWFEQLPPADRAHVIYQNVEVRQGQRLTGQALRELIDNGLSRRRCEELLKEWREDTAIEAAAAPEQLEAKARELEAV